MRGDDQRQGGAFSYVMPEQRIPKDHPLRAVRQMTDQVLRELSPRFEAIYSPLGRPSIPPEQLLRALLLQVLYTVRSERLLMEQLDYNILFRWFVGLNMDDEIWNPTVFSKNRERLLDGDIAQAFFERVLALAREKHLLSDEHFTVDGTLVEAWAGQKSFRKKGTKTEPPEGGSNPTVNFHGEKRSNATHESTTDPEAKLYRKSFGTESKLCYFGHVLMDNRHGLAVGGKVTHATSTAERDAAIQLLAGATAKARATVGADKGYDVRDFVETMRFLKVTPHVAAKVKCGAIDGRTTRDAGYEVSQRKRKLVEQVFGWLKMVGLMRKTRHRGTRRVGWMFVFALAVHNLVRLRNLQAVTT